MKFGTELFRTDNWVLRARTNPLDSQCVIIHECDGKSTDKTLSGVLHNVEYGQIGLDQKIVKRWQCQECNAIATNDIVTLWIMLNWEEMEI